MAHHSHTADPLQLINKHELAALLAVTPRTIDRWRSSGHFPPAIALSDRIVVWRRADIDAWLTVKVEASNG